MAPEAVIDESRRAGFLASAAPRAADAKWRSIREAGAGTRFVVANGAEGEPSTFKDRWLMWRNPYAVVEGLAIASHAVGPRRRTSG
jgi:NADH-quinone oxidoreductase subunit F